MDGGLAPEPQQAQKQPRPFLDSGRPCCPGTFPFAPEIRLSTPQGLLHQLHSAGGHAEPGPTYLGNLGKLPKAGVPDTGDIQKLHLLEGARWEQRNVDKEQGGGSFHTPSRLHQLPSLDAKTGGGGTQTPAFPPQQSGSPYSW